MAELVANFTLNNESLDAQFDISEGVNFDALFEINAQPTKVSQLENDLNFQTEEEVQEAIDEAISSIDVHISGSALIDVSRENNQTVISSKTFVFEQGIPATEWVINHNLNKRPSITLTNYAGEVFEADRNYISNNQVIIRLENADTGYAYLN